MTVEAKSVVQATVELPSGVMVRTEHDSPASDALFGLFNDLVPSAFKTRVIKKTSANLPLTLALEVPQEVLPQTVAALRELVDALARSTR